MQTRRQTSNQGLRKINEGIYIRHGPKQQGVSPFRRQQARSWPHLAISSALIKFDARTAPAH